MKYRVLGLAALLAGALTAGAQTFTIDWAKPDSLKGTPTTTLKRDGTVRNLNDQGKELYFSYDLGGLTLDHTAQLCMNLCWALLPGPDDPFIREGQVLPPNGTLPIYVDLTPHGTEGNSTVAVRLFDGTTQTDRLDFTVTFLVSETASVIDAESLGISVGPLPASDNLTVRGEAVGSMASVGLYDLSGNIVRSFGFSNGPVNTLPLVGLAAGSYRLVFIAKDGTMAGAPVMITR